MNLLEGIIAGATDDSVSTNNLLRKVQVVAHYLKAEEVSGWVKSELNGFSNVDSLPRYRAGLTVPVVGKWAGYFGTSMDQFLSSVGLPKDAEAVLFHASLTQPIAELEDLAALSEDPSQLWDAWQVGQYTRWNAEGKGVWMEDMNLISARRVVTRASIRGVIDTIRNTALDLALSLHTTDINAGTLNGPTMADSPIASTVNHFTTNVYGHGANIAFGDNATQRSKVVANDVESLVTAARAAGLSEEGLTELRAAAEASGEERSSKFKSLLLKMKTGVLLMGAEVTSEVAASQIDQLIKLFLGQSS